MKRYLAIILIVILTAVVFAGCGSSDNGVKDGQFTGTIRIAYQNGMSYAPFYVMQEKKLIEKYLPGVTVKYDVLASGAAVNQALLGDTEDIGVMGVAPLLIGWDTGANYKMLSGLVNSPLDLVVMKDKYKSLKDFENGVDKIAVPAPGSIQDMLLRMASKKELGDANALKDSITGIAHPQAMLQLVNDSGLAGHFSSSPFLFQELDKGGKVIVDGYDAFGGDFSFLVSVATNKFMEEKPAYAAAVYMALSDAIQLVNSKDASTINIIAKKENLSKETVKKYLGWEGTNYTTTPYGVTKLANFMKEAGAIKKVPASLSDFCWNTVTSIVGQRAGAPSVLEKAQNLK